MRFLNEVVELRERAEPRIDAAIIRHVVPEIFHRRRIDRRQPDRIDAQRVRRAVVQVIQSARNARQIADAVAVGILKTPRINLIDNGALPPGSSIIHRGNRSAHATTSFLSSLAFRTA